MSKQFPIFKIIWVGIYSVIGWLIVVPLSYLFPIRKNRIICIGRDDGKFVDNVKYMYLHLDSIHNKESIEHYFLTSNLKTANLLKKNHLPVLLYPSFKTFFKLLQSNIVIVDTNKWVHEWKYFFLHRTKKIQLWHGVPLKKVGVRASNPKEAQKSFSLYYFLRDRFSQIVKYDAVVATSQLFIDHVYSKTFHTKQFLKSGQPRTDIFQQKPKETDLLEADTSAIKILKQRKNEGYQIVYYIPTFRDRGRDPFSDHALNMQHLLKFAQDHKIIFLFKLHPNMNPKILSEFNDSHLIIYNTYQDLYPALQFADILITDYSSIYLDYLLFNRPILFFCYDYNQYITEDRALEFDYHEMTPGVKCNNQKALQQEILNNLEQKNDSFESKRITMRDKTFEIQNGQSSANLWKFLNKTYLNTN